MSKCSRKTQALEKGSHVHKGRDDSNIPGNHFHFHYQLFHLVSQTVKITVLASYIGLKTCFALSFTDALPFVEESPLLLSTNFATRGVLERERHAATNALCRGRIPKQEPQKIPKTIISTMISELPPTATFQTCMQENKLKDLVFVH